MFFDEIVGGSPYIFAYSGTGPPDIEERITREEENEYIRNANFGIR